MNVRPLVLTVLALTVMGQGCSPSAPEEPMTPPVPNAQESATTTETKADAGTKTSTQAPAPTVKTTAPAPKPAPKPTTTATNPAPTGERSAGVKFVNDSMSLSVLVSDKGADLRWTLWTDKDFKGYLLVKSTTDANPYYPKQYYFRFENREVGARFYQDAQMERGKVTYYRVCALDIDESVTCGPVASAKRN